MVCNALMSVSWKSFSEIEACDKSFVYFALIAGGSCHFVQIYILISVWCVKV